MKSGYPFGNDPGKIERYKAFWNRDEVDRPLVGFSFVGWYPLEYFTVCKSWNVNDYITPDMLIPDEWMDDYEELLREGEEVEDEMRLLTDSLDPRGLYLHIMPENKEEIERLRPILGM